MPRRSLLHAALLTAALAVAVCAMGPSATANAAKRHYTSAVLRVEEGFAKSNCVATTRRLTAGQYDYRSHLDHPTWDANAKNGKAKRFDVPRTGRWIWHDCIVYQLDNRPDAKGRFFKAEIFNRTVLVDKSTGKRITLFGPTWGTNSTGGRFEWGSTLRWFSSLEV